MKCGSLNPFSFPKETSAEDNSQEIGYDLHFKGHIPNHELKGNFLGREEEELKTIWFENRFLVLPKLESNVLLPHSFIQISGVSDPKKWKGFSFDIFPSDHGQVQREVSTSQGFSIHTAYRLSLQVIDDLPEQVIGRLYLAIPDSHNTWLAGTFHALKIKQIKFLEDGSSELNLPQNLSHYLTAKVHLLTGNVFNVPENFSRLNDEQKSKLLNEILTIADLELDEKILNFIEESVSFEIPTNTRKLNEAFIYLFTNDVSPNESFWIQLRKMMRSHKWKEQTLIQILRKKFSEQMENIEKDLSHKIVLPKDPIAMIIRDDAESLQNLIESGFDPNFVKEDEDTNPLGFSLLEESMIGNSYHCAKLLLNAGANPNSINSLGETPIFKLCQNNSMHLQNKLDLLDDLIKRDINVNHCSEQRMTALHWCALFGEPSLAKRLLKSGAEVNIPDFRGNTALHEACKFGHSSVLALLLEFGAKANLLNEDGKTGRDLAFEELETAKLQADDENQNRFQRILSLLDVYGG
ncbi:ankyrin repeat protein [Leptospira ryugenii]|uniref:Ankyrin repeat protein n=2 Tax=Leptospira ryugenii TaxID=1917863 RepID=A0A2P2E1Z2_9LEPT|nr:ankyrin repeat protein [Leptospira ryugenii]